MVSVLTKITLDLRAIPRCAKSGCKHRELMHRHHTSHQWMFVIAFAQSHAKRKKYRQFVRRYSSFNKEDIELLCPGHHGQIHEVYDHIILRSVSRTLKPLAEYTWSQANILMSALRTTYYKWKEIETEESNPYSSRLQPIGEEESDLS